MNVHSIPDRGRLIDRLSAPQQPLRGGKFTCFEFSYYDFISSWSFFQIWSKTSSKLSQLETWTCKCVTYTSSEKHVLFPVKNHISSLHPSSHPSSHLLHKLLSRFTRLEPFPAQNGPEAEHIQVTSFKELTNKKLDRNHSQFRFSSPTNLHLFVTAWVISTSA